MLNLVHAEIYKLSKSLGIKICFLLSCICAAAIVYVSYSIATGGMSEEVMGSASGLSDIVIISLLGSLMAGVIVCSDFESKTIHDSIACGNGRRSIVISKFLVYVLVIVLLLLPYMVATIIGFCSFSRFSTSFVTSVFTRILSSKSAFTVNAGVIGKIINLSLVTMLIHAARLSFCIPLAFKIRKPIAILAIGFIFNAVIDLIVSLLMKVKILTEVLSFTPFARKFLMMNMTTDTATLWKAAISSIIFLGLMAAVTYITFRKADIK